MALLHDTLANKRITWSIRDCQVWNNVMQKRIGLDQAESSTRLNSGTHSVGQLSSLHKSGYNLSLGLANPIWMYQELRIQPAI